MKSILIITAMMACLNLTNCATDPAAQKAQLTSFANIAVNALATANPQQAALIRTGGALVIKAVNGENIKAEEASNLAIDLAVAQEKLTPEQAAELRSAITVPLAPVNPLLPAP